MDEQQEHDAVGDVTDDTTVPADRHPLLHDAVADHEIEFEDGFVHDIDDFLLGHVEPVHRTVFPWVTLALALIVALAYAIEVRVLGTSPSPRDLYDVGAFSRAALDNGEWWRIIGSGILHFNPLHVLLNLLFLLAVGTAFERVVGHAFTFGVAMTSIAASSLLSALEASQQVGAGISGMAFGLMGATVALDPRARTGLGGIMRWLLVFNIALALVVASADDFGISLPSVIGETSNGAHLGGLLAGAAFGLIAHAVIDGTRWRGFTWIAVGLAIVAALLMATHPKIAGAANQNEFDRAISRDLLQERLLERLRFDDSEYQRVGNASCTTELEDGSRWRCTVETRVDGTRRDETWVAMVDKDAAIQFLHYPDTPEQLSRSVIESTDGEASLRLVSVGCREDDSIVGDRAQDTNNPRGWRCLVDGTEGEREFIESWTLVVRPDGSWTQLASVPTSKSVERTIKREGLQSSKGTTTVDAVACIQLTDDGTSFSCRVRDHITVDGQRVDTDHTYAVEAKEDGSWKLTG